MKKKHLFTILFCVLFTVVNAQSNFGTDYYGIGELPAAKKYFESQVSQTPAESNYYLGEIAFAEGKMDEAKSYFDKGFAADPLNMLNVVGQGKLLIKSDPKAAEALFSSAMKKNKKNPLITVGIAKAYLDCGMKDVAQAKLAIAKKNSKKSPLVFIFEGDLLLSDIVLDENSDKNKLGAVGQKYEQALYIDPTNVVANYKCAVVYESINPALSVEKLTAILAAHPDYIVANRELGKSYNAVGQYKKAIEAFTIYAAQNTLKVDDYVKFATAYYFTDQFSQSIELINEGLKLDSSNFVLNRFRMYNAAKTEDEVNGVAYADYFFSLKSEKGFIPTDYTAYATVLTNAGQFQKALDIYAKIVETDPSKPEIQKELYGIYNKMGDRVKAAECMQKFVDLTGVDNVTAVDYYLLGKAYYAAGSPLMSDSTITDKTQAKDLLVKADTVFGTVCNLTPDSYTGYLWRGHTNALLDPDFSKGLAKPYYEAAVTAILNKSKETGLNGNKKDLIRCYQYLGYYYFLKEDKANATKYYNSILELDPTDKNANLILESYKPAKK